MKAGLHPLLRDARAVLFDAGGTLVHPEWSRLARIAEAETGRAFTPEEMRRMLYEVLRGVDRNISEGNSNLAHTRRPGWLFHDMFCALGVDTESCERMSAPLLAEHAQRHLWCEIDAEAHAVIARLKGAGLRVGVISNTDDGRVRESLEDIADQFDLLVDSFIVGLRKPDVRIFQYALEQLGVAANEAVYVGDSYGHDVLGAERAGLRAILLDPSDFYAGSDCARIHSLGALVNHA
ncbi:MAG: HAD family hydrolase [Acidobacteriota bacterium]|nr:HAD family hydrolase [Acidobacteriota bacterium]